MGHKAVAYEEIRALVKSLQPDCLLTDHTHLQDPWEVDIVNFEEPRGAFVPAGNTYAGNQEQKINASGGNDWFWAPNIGGLMSVTDIVDNHLRVLEPRWTNFLLNCPPNREGLLDAAIVSAADRGRASVVAETRRARRCRRRGRTSSSRTRRRRRPRPAARRPAPSTASTTTTATRSGARRARCRSRSRSISARRSPTSGCWATCPST